MFESLQQFFPTPSYIATKMLQKLKELSKFGIGELLDPSAGKGDLLDVYAKNARHWETKTAYTIEIDPELQGILRDKGYKVIGSDFLQFDEPIEFQSILMNPPFNNGVHHVLKAWSILKPTGNMVALVNTETINNPYSSERKRLIELIDLFGDTENIGQCFKEADRTTDVEVVMIWLSKPANKINPNEFEFSGDFRKFDDDVFNDFATNPLASVDAIDSLVAQYRCCLEALKVKHKAQIEFDYHIRSLGRLSSSTNTRGDDKLGDETDWLKDVQDLKYRFWWAVFKMSRMSEINTTDFKKKFQKFVETQVNMAFDKPNILEALAIFFQNKDQIMIDSIVSVFDAITKYHPDNKVHHEGWKSNSGWKINSKIIVPWGITWDAYWNRWDCNWGSVLYRFLDDLDEVFSWIAEKPFDEMVKTTRLIEQPRYDKSLATIAPGVWKQGEFYDFKLFKKGTVHIRFRDQYLLDDFNMLAGKGKNWIGN